MPIKSEFFAQLREPLTVSNGAHRLPLFERYSQQQVNSLNAVVAVFDAFTGHDHCVDDLAYILATCYRECGPALNLAIEEVGHGSTKPYGKAVAPYNKKYYGRGPSQCTWLANYQKAKLSTGIDFVQFPEYMCDPAKGIVYMIEAMYRGRFTGHTLRNYIVPGKVTTLEAFTLARHIINGTDHAAEVAYVALGFRKALMVGYDAPPPAVAPVKAPQATATRPQARLSLWAGVRKMFGGK